MNIVQGPANKKSSSPAMLMQPRKKTPIISPSKKPTTRSSSLKPQVSRFNFYRRPHSRSDSQDSFACDPSDKPEEQFLAKSDKFALPLSELAEHPSPTRGPSNDTISSSYARDSPPAGRVLVEATPSYSGSSLNDEPHIIQNLEETQLVEDPRPENRQVLDEMTVDKEGSGYESSEPSSSYHRFLDGDRDPDMQPTQPSTQVDASTSNIFAEDAIPWSNIRSVPASSGPNSLMSMVDPRKRWRYVNRDPPPPASKSFPPPNVSNSRNSPVRVRPRPPSPVPPDTMDVVPDSEPVVEDNVGPIAPRVRRHAQDSPLPLLNDSVVRESDAHMEVSDQLKNITQQKEEEEDEEDEIPLAALARKAPHNQAHGKPSAKSKTPVKILSNKASNMVRTFHSHDKFSFHDIDRRRLPYLFLLPRARKLPLNRSPRPEDLGNTLWSPLLSRSRTLHPNSVTSVKRKPRSQRRQKADLSKCHLHVLVINEGQGELQPLRRPILSKNQWLMNLTTNS